MKYILKEKVLLSGLLGNNFNIFGTAYNSAYMLRSRWSLRVSPHFCLRYRYGKNVIYARTLYKIWPIVRHPGLRPSGEKKEKLEDEMNNGTSEKVIEHFNKVAMLPDKWDHNQQYQNYMLRQIKKRCEIGLDIGCGTGEFTKRLLSKCDNLIGIDVAPKMIEEACNRNFNERIKYLNADVNEFLEGKEEYFDVIVSIASFHHMDYEAILEKCRKALKSGGVLIIQDLYNENTVIFNLLQAMGCFLHPICMLAKNGYIKQSTAEREVWKHHNEDDLYNSIYEIKNITNKVLTDFKIRRHIFWRYTLIYYKK